jgi:hypothetical protein
MNSRVSKGSMNVNMTLTELIKKVSTKIVMKRGLISALSTTGNIGIRIRRNLLLETLLKQRVATCGMLLSTTNVYEIRKRTLSYVESMRIKTRPYGQYRYSALNEKPVLYASIYACLIRHLYKDMDWLSEDKRGEWINYIQNYQANDGLFKDPVVENQLADSIDWWGWRHLTLHATMALTALGAVAQKRFRFLERFKNRHSVMEWLKSRNWKDNPANVSNEIQNYGALLQYARDFQGERWADDALENLFDGLDKLQDTETGLWGDRFDTPAFLSNSVQTSYHILLLYFYDQRPIRYAERIIDCCLATQNKLGGFAPFLNSSACEDIDSIDPVARLYFVTSRRKAEIRSAMNYALRWVLTNMNPDGGFVFRRFEPFIYGHEDMFSTINQSAMFPTWFRTLSLAYISKILPNSIVGRFYWNFIDCPGYQFWRK